MRRLDPAFDKQRLLELARRINDAGRWGNAQHAKKQRTVAAIEQCAEFLRKLVAAAAASPVRLKVLLVGDTIDQAAQVHARACGSAHVTGGRENHDCAHRLSRSAQLGFDPLWLTRTATTACFERLGLAHTPHGDGSYSNSRMLTATADGTNVFEWTVTRGDDVSVTLDVGVFLHPSGLTEAQSDAHTARVFGDLVARLHSGEYTAPRVVTDASKFDSAELQQRITDAKRGRQGARVPVRA